MSEDQPTNHPETEKPEKAARKKSPSKRKAQIDLAKSKLAEERKTGNQNPIVQDATYGELREENRVVMRHQIALNIDSFRAAPDAFQARPTRSHAPLTPVVSPFFSIIVPTLNGLRWLPTLMNALAAQTLRDFEVIVVDDGSTDATVAWLEAHHPQVRVVVNRRNLGFVAACNLGADVARGRILVFLNNDTEPEAGWAEALAQAVCANPHVAIFASKLLLFDRRDTLHSAGDTLGVDGIPRNRGVWQPDSGQYDRQPVVFSGCGGAVAYRRDVWTALEGFDEAFWMYLEDTDFAFRAQLLGYEARFVPDARVYHHLSATAGGELASFYVGRNTVWLLVKNMPRHVLRRYGLRMVMAQAAIAWEALCHWRGAAARARLRGQLAGIVGIAVMLRKRQVIQRRRLLDDRELAAKLVD
jgi:GT2 family glycosyltransferase